MIIEIIMRGCIYVSYLFLCWKSGFPELFKEVGTAQSSECSDYIPLYIERICKNYSTCNRKTWIFSWGTRENLKIDNNNLFLSTKKKRKRGGGYNEWERYDEDKDGEADVRFASLNMFRAEWFVTYLCNLQTTHLTLAWRQFLENKFANMRFVTRYK